MRNPHVLQGTHEEVETEEGKEQWWRSLTFEERYEHIEHHMTLLMSLNPRVAKAHDHKPSDTVRVVELP